MEQAMARSEDTTQLDAVLTQPEDRQTLAESITGRLRQLILDGQLPPGQALRPADLAPRLGVSVMPVREALRILEAEGLVTFRPRIGARVAEIKEEDVEELYLVRVALEGLAARLGAANLTDAGLGELHEAFDEMTAARARDDFDAFSQYDREFHRRQYAASGRPGLVKRILDLWDVGRRIYAIAPRTGEFMDPAYEAHRAILEALDRRDADAAELRTRIHTEEAAERILMALRELHSHGEAASREDEQATA
jgi:GntR family transcriptional regulator, rspAB operon transcriptional repressor